MEAEVDSFFTGHLIEVYVRHQNYPERLSEFLGYIAAINIETNLWSILAFSIAEALRIVCEAISSIYWRFLRQSDFYVRSQCGEGALSQSDIKRRVMNCSQLRLATRRITTIRCSTGSRPFKSFCYWYTSFFMCAIWKWRGMSYKFVFVRQTSPTSISLASWQFLCWRNCTQMKSEFVCGNCLAMTKLLSLLI